MAKVVKHVSHGGPECRYEVEAVAKQYVIVRRFRAKDGVSECVGESRFEIGDWAEYDSYNLSYYGPIQSISEKGVVIKERYGSSPRSYRLNWDKFAWRNWDFSVAAAQHSNSEAMQYI